MSPRPGLGIDGKTRDRLHALEVDYVEEPLNRACPEYGSANRVFAAAWAEPRTRSEWIVVLDSDTVFLAEPELPAGADAAVRPVDVKGCASAGPGDPMEGYWTALAALQGLPLDRLPYVDTTVGDARVRASYNGGLVAVRRDRGILAAWADLFARSIAAGLRPWAGHGLDVYASTGFVGPRASELWGSNQAALALALWTRTEKVVHFPEAYNVPLHQVVEHAALKARPRGPLVHVHYHWLFTEAHQDTALAALHDLGAGPDRLEWLRERLPLP